MLTFKLKLMTLGSGEFYHYLVDIDPIHRSGPNFDQFAAA